MGDCAPRCVGGGAGKHLAGVRAGDRARGRLRRVRRSGRERRRPRRLPRSDARPADSRTRAAAVAAAGRAARARDRDARRGARADSAADRRHGRDQEPVALPSPRHRRPHPAAARGRCGGRLVLARRDPGDTAHPSRPPHRATRGYGTSIRAASGFAWAAGLHDPRVTARGVAKARALALQTLVYTVNEPSRLLALDEMGVDGVFTDCPGLARETLARRPG